MTDLIFAFSAGLALSFVGSLPPGIINSTVAFTALKNGFWKAVLLAAGAATAEFFQALVAVRFTDWYAAHPDFETAAKWTTGLVFAALGFYFLWKKPTAPRSKVEPPSGQFFYKGLIISVFNLVAIPYWIFYCAYFRSHGWLSTGWPSTFSLAVGVVVGTLGALVFYAFLAAKITGDSSKIDRWASRILALVFIGLGGWQLFSLLVF